MATRRGGSVVQRQAYIIQSSGDGHTLRRRRMGCVVLTRCKCGTRGLWKCTADEGIKARASSPTGTTPRRVRWPPILPRWATRTIAVSSGGAASQVPMWLVATDGRWWLSAVDGNPGLRSGADVVAEAQARKQGSISVDGRKPEWQSVTVIR
ncbi:hypothetical protein K438DRAFT_1955829 [Mycena galopus ATCC 62051]|nr:hypothetical protein K438DRAFT_1955829 [Mycena galopus ATCC 62051]